MSHLAQPSNLDGETAPRGIVSIGRQRLPWQWEPPGSPNSGQTPRYFGIEQFLPAEHARRIIAGIDISGGTAGSEHGATVGMAGLARGSMAVVGRQRRFAVRERQQQGSPRLLRSSSECPTALRRRKLSSLRFGSPAPSDTIVVATVTLSLRSTTADLSVAAGQLHKNSPFLGLQIKWRVVTRPRIGAAPAINNARLLGRRSLRFQRRRTTCKCSKPTFQLTRKQP